MRGFREVIMRRSSRREEGSEVISTLFLVPIIVGLIFVLVDVSTYFQTRSTVQNIARDGARQVSLYGGAASNVPLNTSGRNVAETVYNRLWDGSNCTPSACTVRPSVVCGPNISTNLNQQAYCTVSYRYMSAGGGLVQWLGFGDLLAFPINVTESFSVETRY